MLCSALCSWREIAERIPCRIICTGLSLGTAVLSLGDQFAWGYQWMTALGILETRGIFPVLFSLTVE